MQKKVHFLVSTCLQIAIFAKNYICGRTCRQCAFVDMFFNSCLFTVRYAICRPNADWHKSFFRYISKG